MQGRSVPGAVGEVLTAQAQVQLAEAQPEVAEGQARVGEGEAEAAAQMPRWQPKTVEVEVAKAEGEELLLPLSVELMALPALQRLQVQLMTQALLLIPAITACSGRSSTCRRT